MKTLIALSLVTLVVAPWSARADDELPKPLAFARYEGMTNRSPFAVATAATPPPQAPNFAKDLYVANVGKSGNDALVTIASNVDKNLKEYVSTKEPNPHGYAITNLELSDRVGQTKVTITKDGQVATLSFNQALISQPVANSPGQPVQQPQPQVTNAIPGAVPAAAAIPTPIAAMPVNPQVQNQPPANAIKGGAAPVPTLPTPPPRVRGVIQRNPNAGATPVADDRAQLMQDQ